MRPGEVDCANAEAMMLRTNAQVLARRDMWTTFPEELFSNSVVRSSSGFLRHVVATGRETFPRARNIPRLDRRRLFARPTNWRARGGHGARSAGALFAGSRDDVVGRSERGKVCAMLDAIF